MVRQWGETWVVPHSVACSKNPGHSLQSALTLVCAYIHTYIHTYIHVYYVVLSIHVLSIPCPEYFCGYLIITPQHVAKVSDGHIV